MASWQPAETLAQIERAAAQGRLSAEAAGYLRRWLTEPEFGEYTGEIARHVEGEMWKELDDAFCAELEFGTGGLRGRMYPIGPNVVNDRTIGASAQGLAEYVLSVGGGGKPSAAIAYDTRHRSPEFARLCSEVLAAAGFTVYFLEGYRSTPELSFAVRSKGCSCGIMVTASHNPPSDNAVKVYWSTGGQLVPPHDTGVIERVKAVREIRRMPFEEARAAGRIVMCQEEVDREYIEAASAVAQKGPRAIKILYSPLHGVGSSAVLPLLKAAGFQDVELFGLHSEPNGDFPNVPGHVSNPENPAVFDAIIEHARASGAELILATDPDCDRVGCAVPDVSGKWRTFTGNQIAGLLTEYVLDSRRAAKSLSAKHYVAKTLVTTELVRRIATSHGVRTVGDLHVGFKWIGEAIDVEGPELFVFGAEESHGYLAGTHARDKDGAVAAMLVAELAAAAKQQGKTLVDKLDSLYWQHGCHVERTISITAGRGLEGMERMKQLMTQFRTAAPRALGGLAVAALRDYAAGTRVRYGADGKPSAPEKLAAPLGEMLMFDLAAAGNYIAVRPSGTEPKVKFYMFAFEPPEQLANLDDAKQALGERLDAIEADLRAIAK